MPIPRDADSICMMKVPHPIPYQGSKRLLAPLILEYFPEHRVKLIEPFAGAAAVSLAAAYNNRVIKVVLNDVNAPLMELWKFIINGPEKIEWAYGRLWHKQLGRERDYYDIVREKFNVTHKPHLLLYLLARCVKASIRYNSQGEFNQSPDNRRKGMHPDTLNWHVEAASQLLRGKTIVTAVDYQECLKQAVEGDVVYMDPPYQGVCLNRDPRYMKGLEFDKFTMTLRELNARNISYILSYDGKTGDKSFGKPMPSNLDLVHLEIEVGRSSQATLLGRDHITHESIYLSPALIERIGRPTRTHLTVTPKQFSLLARHECPTEAHEGTT